MKMKKEIVTMLLAAALMTSSLTACTEVEAAGNDMDNITVENTTENHSTTSTTSTDTNNQLPSKWQTSHTFLASSYTSCTYIDKPYELEYQYKYCFNGTQLEFSDQQFYIPIWNKYFDAPTEIDPLNESTCATVIGNKAWVFSSNIDTLTIFAMDDITGETKQSTIQHPYMQYLFCSFLNEKSGYLLGFTEGSKVVNEISSRYVSLTYLLTTTDGGNTWEPINFDVQNAPMYDWKHRPIMAHFFDQGKGMISFRDYTSPSLSSRTFVTFDSGKTWKSLSEYGELNIPNQGIYDSAAISNFDYSNGVYTIVVRIAPEHGGEYMYAKLISHDLKTWSPIE